MILLGRLENDRRDDYVNLPASLDMHIPGDTFLYDGLKNTETVHFKIPCKKYCVSDVRLPTSSLHGATKGRVRKNSSLSL